MRYKNQMRLWKTTSKLVVADWAFDSGSPAGSLREYWVEEVERLA